MDPHIDWPAGYRQFFTLFNERDFFEAHEVLEDEWIMEVPPLRNYYKGLIQAAVALCHWERGNHRGARRLWVLARNYLGAYPDYLEGFALRPFISRMEELFRPLMEDLEATPPLPPYEQLPVISLDFPDDPDTTSRAAIIT